MLNTTPTSSGPDDSLAPYRAVQASLRVRSELRISGLLEGLASAPHSTKDFVTRTNRVLKVLDLDVEFTVNSGQADGPGGLTKVACALNGTSLTLTVVLPGRLVAGQLDTAERKLGIQATRLTEHADPQVKWRGTPRAEGGWEFRGCSTFDISSDNGRRAAAAFILGSGRIVPAIVAPPTW
jgi:hypothetical protein